MDNLFSINLRKIRKERGVTQEQLADAVGVGSIGAGGIQMGNIKLSRRGASPRDRGFPERNYRRALRQGTREGNKYEPEGIELYKQNSV